MSAPCSSTAAVRAGIDCDSAHGAVMPPIYLSSNYSFAGFGEKRKYDYTRSGNPTRDTLAGALAELEGGASGVVTATGMAAVALVATLLEPGELLLAPHDCYGGTWRLFNAQAQRGLYRVAFVDFHDPLALAAALAEKPKLVWIETPSNPLLRITDIRHVVESAHATGALAAVDNTFLSPVLQKPFTFNADIVVHSTTKYINGHSDVVGGAVLWRDAALGEKLAWWCNCLGLSGAPFDSYLTLRGLRTLKARFNVHEANAHALAQLLDAHPAVRIVHYPGLESHPGHALAKRQQAGFGAMLGFELEHGELGARAFVEGLQHFTLAESLGGVESLVCHPAGMTHAAMAPEARRRAGIGDGLLRLSVGIEDVDDLLDDVRAGLDRALAVQSGAGCVCRLISSIPALPMPGSLVSAVQQSARFRLEGNFPDAQAQRAASGNLPVDGFTHAKSKHGDADRSKDGDAVGRGVRVARIDQGQLAGFAIAFIDDGGGGVHGHHIRRHFRRVEYGCAREFGLQGGGAAAASVRLDFQQVFDAFQVEAGDDEGGAWTVHDNSWVDPLILSDCGTVGHDC
jgi:cystathionine gamma-synthase